MGWFAIVVGGAITALSVVGGFAPVPLAVGVLLVLLAWVALLRPRVGITGSELVMRGLVSTLTLPLAAVESVTVRQVLAVWVAGKRYVSAAVGHSYRDIVRARRLPSRGEAAPVKTVAYADHIADIVTDRARAAREEAGVRARSSEQADLARGVHRSWAWPEIAALVLVGAGLVAALAL